MRLYLLQGEGVDPTQTSTSSRSEQSRKSKTHSQLCSICIHRHCDKHTPVESCLLAEFSHGFVLLQAVLDFHRQVGNVVTHVSDQYEELFEARCKPSEDCSREQMKIQLMGMLNISARYLTFKEQMKVRTTTHIPGGWIKLTGTLKLFFRVDV